MTELRTITADGITKLLNACSVDCNAPTVGDVEAIRDGFCLFLTRHAATCPTWGKRARDHGVDVDTVVVHPLGRLDDGALVYLGDASDEVCRG